MIPPLVVTFAMRDMSGNAVGSITGKIDQVGKSANQAKAKVKGLESQLGELDPVTQRVSSAMSTLRGFIGGVLSSIAGGTILRGAIDEFGQYEVAVTRLTHVLENQGTASQRYINELTDQANAIEKLTTFQDEAIIPAQALLASYGLQGEALKRATKATVDYAATGRLNIETAAALIGKSFLGVTNTLRRYGIVISDTLAPSEKFAKVMEVIEKRFGGLAQAEAQSYIGKITQLKNEFGNVRETLGEVLIPVFAEAAERMKQGAEAAQEWLRANEDIIQQKTESVLRGIGTAMSIVADNAGKISVVFGGLAAYGVFRLMASQVVQVVELVSKLAGALNLARVAAGVMWLEIGGTLAGISVIGAGIAAIAGLTYKTIQARNEFKKLNQVEKEITGNGFSEMLKGNTESYRHLTAELKGYNSELAKTYEMTLAAANQPMTGVGNEQLKGLIRSTQARAEARPDWMRQHLPGQDRESDSALAERRRKILQEESAITDGLIVIYRRRMDAIKALQFGPAKNFNYSPQRSVQELSDDLATRNLQIAEQEKLNAAYRDESAIKNTIIQNNREMGRVSEYKATEFEYEKRLNDVMNERAELDAKLDAARIERLRNQTGDFQNKTDDNRLDETILGYETMLRSKDAQVALLKVEREQALSMVTTKEDIANARGLATAAQNQAEYIAESNRLKVESRTLTRQEAEDATDIARMKAINARIEAAQMEKLVSPMIRRGELQREINQLQQESNLIVDRGIVAEITRTRELERQKLAGVESRAGGALNNFNQLRGYMEQEAGLSGGITGFLRVRKLQEDSLVKEIELRKQLAQARIASATEARDDERLIDANSAATERAQQELNTAIEEYNTLLDEAAIRTRIMLDPYTRVKNLTAEFASSLGEVRGAFGGISEGLDGLLEGLDNAISRANSLFTLFAKIAGTKNGGGGGGNSLMSLLGFGLQAGMAGAGGPLVPNSPMMPTDGVMGPFQAGFTMPKTMAQPAPVVNVAMPSQPTPIFVLDMADAIENKQKVGDAIIKKVEMR